MKYAATALLCTLSTSLLVAPAFAATPKNPTQDVSFGSQVAITAYLSLPNAAAAEKEAQLLQTPGSSAYHHFLSEAEFVNKYAPTEADLKSVENELIGLGYTISYVYPNRLAIEVISSTSNVEKTLGIQLKAANKSGNTGMMPSGQVKMPASLKGKLLGFGGLNTVTHAHPMHVQIPNAPAPRAIPAVLTGGEPGEYLPADFEKRYKVGPLYTAGVSGKGTTIGIVTLANYDKSDAYLFWKAIGLHVAGNRLTSVDVDGGTSIAPSESRGEDETDLDIEQAGAIAPAANIRVYVSPNESTANFINGFEAAASENIADTVSSSWGSPEIEYFYDQIEQSDETFLLDAFHAVFLEMALQGQTVYIASGDSGSYDTVRDFGCGPYGAGTPDDPLCSAPYALDHPSSDPLVTAAGGTTTPLDLFFQDGPEIKVNQEQAWSWTYVVAAAKAQGYADSFPVQDFFSVGDGGGVSSYYKLPWYQAGVAGTTVTKPGQVFRFNQGSGFETEFVFPSNFAGRNSPDLSADADPYSGYQLFTGGQLYIYNGGTSFVAPQLNGVTALFVEGLDHHRVGQINPILYSEGLKSQKDIAIGNNWGYHSYAGYDNAAGVGSLDATTLFVDLAAKEAAATK